VIESRKGRARVENPAIVRMTGWNLRARRVGAALLTAFAVQGCATAPLVVPSGPPAPRLPPPPLVLDQPLRIDVVYPGAGASVAASDSTFIFGNVGRGNSQLTINGAPVEVAPNGAWLAYLPVPADGAYRLTASAGGESVSATHQVRVPVPAAAGVETGALRIVESSVAPTGPITGVRGEAVEVRFRGTPGAEARLRLPDGTVVILTEQPAIDRASGFMLDRAQTNATLSEYVGSLVLSSTIATGDPAVEAPTLIAAEEYVEQQMQQGGQDMVVELARGNEFVQVSVPAAIAVLEEGSPRVAVAATTRPDRTVIGRRALGADQAWDFFWPNGTLLTIDGEAPGFYRVQLTDDLSAWVAIADVQLLPAGARPPRGFVGPSVQLTPRDGWVDVRFSMSDRLPFRVVPAEWGLSIEFYRATGRPMYTGYGVETGFVQRVDWEQETDELFVFNVLLNEPLWGYRYDWEGSTLMLQVRQPPTIDPASPLRGLRIGVDAGHNGGVGDTGAIGPTRLTEVEATQTVVKRLAAMLAEVGADVLEIRPDTAIVPLVERPIIATEADADLLVSVHFNAFPDGVDPFANHGTTMFYYWPHSLEFARHLQREILAEVGLPDRGVRFQNLGMTRTTWMPSVLTETLYLMFPEQEAAARDPAIIDRIAEAHLRAMESFVRERVAAVPGGGPR
jgi:N-acetylmuramoyl-L-alanine amidase